MHYPYDLAMGKLLACGKRNVAPARRAQRRCRALSLATGNPPRAGIVGHGRRPGPPREERLAFWSRAVPLPVRGSAARAVLARRHTGTRLPAPADLAGGGSARASEAGGRCVPRAAALAISARAQRWSGRGGFLTGAGEACAQRPRTQLAGVGDGTAVNLRARPWSAR